MLIFLKLGGSLITDKSKPETPRTDVIDRLAQEISRAVNKRHDLRLVIGHGSGSYGHVAAKQFSTHLGVESADDWRGFAKVGLSASRLNYIIADSLDRAGVPIFRIQPSASAICNAGVIREMALTPLKRALDHNLVPLLYGDVSFDDVRGGSIMSTEDVFTFVSKSVKPDRMLLIGDYEGVFDETGVIISKITPASFEQVQSALGGSKHTDVTGGMSSKVRSMLDLCIASPGLSVHIFAGDEPHVLENALLSDNFSIGTKISAPQ